MLVSSHGNRANQTILTIMKTLWSKFSEVHSITFSSRWRTNDNLWNDRNCVVNKSALCRRELGNLVDNGKDFDALLIPLS